MSSLKLNLWLLRFHLFDWLNVHNDDQEEKETVKLTLDLIGDFTKEVLWPAQMEINEKGVTFENGKVILHEKLKETLSKLRTSGYMNADLDEEDGGGGMSKTVGTAIVFLIMQGYADILWPELTIGAAHLIKKFGTKEQKERYLPKMFCGEDSGTMCITEPGAGSGAGEIASNAVKNPDGSYSITGPSQFISCGDDDFHKNTNHIKLARIEGEDPEKGTKTLSMFIIPKILPDGSRNSYVVDGIEHKLGLPDSPTCSLYFDGATGYLLGKKNEGFTQMTELMNDARRFTGVQSLAVQQTAYSLMAEYAGERKQFRKTLKNLPLYQERMIKMQSHIMAGMGLAFYTANICEQVRQGDTSKQPLLDLLTPLVKACISNNGLFITDMAVQGYGGYGFTKEYPVERLQRTARIMPIYEGTNDMQYFRVGQVLGSKEGIGAYMTLMLTMDKKSENFLKQRDEAHFISKLWKNFRSAMNEFQKHLLTCGSNKKRSQAITAETVATSLDELIKSFFMLEKAEIAWKAMNISENKSLNEVGKELQKHHEPSDKEAQRWNIVSCANWYIHNVTSKISAKMKAAAEREKTNIRIIV